MRMLSNINLALNRAGVIDMGVYKVISDDRTIYIGAAGDDTTGDGSSTTPWETLDKVFDYLSDYRIVNGAMVTVSVSAGTYSSVPSVSIRHMDASRIKIIGSSASSAAHAVTGISSASKTVDVAGDETATFAAGSVVSIMGSTDNDSTYTVDSVAHVGGTTTVTLDQAPQSDTADGTMRSHPASMTHIFEMATDAELEVYGTALAELSGICIVGDSARGLVVTQGGRIEASEGLVVRDCTHGIEIAFDSAVSATTPVVHGCSGTGIYCHDLSACNLSKGALSCHHGARGFYANTLSPFSIAADGSGDTQLRAVAANNSSAGFYAVANSYMNANYAQAINNGAQGIFVQYDSFFSANTPSVLNNTSHGVYAIQDSGAQIANVVADNNGGTGLYARERGTIICNSGTSDDNGAYGVLADEGSHVNFSSGSASGNTTAATSPATNTVGNANSYITS